MTYKDLISINENFQSSINLNLDLGNESKVINYIPTADNCATLKAFLSTACGRAKDFSTLLVGPYGKGKSYLLLILSYILSNPYKSKVFKNLLSKIKSVDSELYDLICLYSNSQKKLLTVLINGNPNDLKQSFLVGLSDALSRNSLEKIRPSSVFDVCLNIVSKWQKSKELETRIAKKCVSKYKISLEELIAGLHGKSQKAYKQFESIYNCMSIGQKFNPLLGTDVCKLYENILPPLKDHGFSGLFIIFDEFSKFIEDSSASLFSNLKLIQDFAELSSRSSLNSQIHFCCVIHKSLSLYGNLADANALKTVEGRFKELSFNRKIDENYEIIGNAIEKKAAFENYFPAFYEANAKKYGELRKLNLGNNQLLEKDCFPLNPLTTYCLVRLSERIAQNERTLFTFLSDSDDNSLASFIHNPKNTDSLINLDTVFSYFEPLFKHNENPEIRQIFYRANACLSKVHDNEERRFIKSLAIILMTDDIERISPVPNTISLGAFLESGAGDHVFNSLLSKGLIRISAINNFVSFASTNNKAIEDSLSLIRPEILQSFDIDITLGKIYRRKYYLPRKYNQEYKITRFFPVRFINEELLTNLNDVDSYIDTTEGDGIVLCVLKDKSTTGKIESILNQKVSSKTVAIIPTNCNFGLLQSLGLKYECLCSLLKDNIDDVLCSEIKALIDETSEEIEVILEDAFEDSQNIIFTKVDVKGNCALQYSEISSILSFVAESMFPNTPIFNNELINKNEVTGQYLRAIEHVNDFLLNNEHNFPYSPTSPESSVLNSVISFNENNMDADTNYGKVIRVIEDKILSSEGNKTPFSQIVTTLLAMPYGLRKGVISTLFCNALSKVAKTIVLYYHEKEITLSASNITKAIANSDDYYFMTAQGTYEEMDFIDHLLDFFKVTNRSSFLQNISFVAESLRNAFVSLPQIVKSCSNKNNFLDINPLIFSYRSLFVAFNINPYDAVITKTKSIFGNYVVAQKEIIGFFTTWETKLNDFKGNLIQSIKELLHQKDTSSLKMDLVQEIKALRSADSNPIFKDSIDASLYSTILSLKSFDDFLVVNELSRCITGFYIEDWNSNRSEEVTHSIHKLYECLGHAEELNLTSLFSQTNSNDSSSLSPFGLLLKNQIHRDIDDYSDSISNKEKIDVLVQIIKSLM